MKTSSSPVTSIYTLRVELEGVAPLIWRRLHVPTGIPLTKLHNVLQVAMGWTDSHLHRFSIGTQEYGVQDELEESDIIDERGHRLDLLLDESIRQFGYLYDFGDGWEHRLVVESRSLAKPAWPYPLCVAGERACPPEDVGGHPGYEEFLMALRDAKHEDHDRLLLWAGGSFDPEGFDINAVNRELRRQRL